MPNQDAFPTVFARLKAMLTPFSPSLTVQTDTAAQYTLNVPASEKHPTGLDFGTVWIRKNYVSYYLMPVYTFPDLLEDVPATLRKRMQGKSCFNFTMVDEEMMAALETLTARGFARYRHEHLA